MNTEILKKYIKSNYEHIDFSDLYFLEELTSRIISAFGIEDYLKKLKIEDLRLEEAVALYRYNKKSISLDIDETDRMIKYEENENNIEFPSYFKSYFYYYHLIHECIHAIHFKIWNNSIESLHKTLIDDSFKVSNGNFKLNQSKSFKSSIFLNYVANKFYDHNHDLFPIEKEAYFHSISIITEIYEPIIKDEKLLKYIILNYLKVIFSGYIFKSRIISPTEQFYSSIKRLDKFKSFNYRNLKFYKRISLGLPITMKEVYKCVSENVPNNGKTLSMKISNGTIQFK